MGSGDLHANPVQVLTHQEQLSHDGSWPQEPAPSAATWQRQHMTAQNITASFGWQGLGTIHSLLAKQLPHSSPRSWAHTHVHETHANMPVASDPNSVPLGWQQEWEQEWEREWEQEWEQLPHAAIPSCSQCRSKQAEQCKNPILDNSIPHGSGRLEEGREGKKGFAFFAFHQGICSSVFFLFMSTVNLFKIQLGKTKYEWIKLKSIFVLITAFWKLEIMAQIGTNTPTVNHRERMREKAVWALKRTVQMSSGNLTARGINFNTNEQCTRRPAADGSDSLLFYVLFFLPMPAWWVICVWCSRCKLSPERARAEPGGGTAVLCAWMRHSQWIWVMLVDVHSKIIWLLIHATWWNVIKHLTWEISSILIWWVIGERKSGNCKGRRGFWGTGNVQKEKYQVKEKVGWGKSSFPCTLRKQKSE